jgi:hypothetical protein
MGIASKTINPTRIFLLVSPMRRWLAEVGGGVVQSRPKPECKRLEGGHCVTT